MKSTKILSVSLCAFLLLLASCQIDDGPSDGGEQVEIIPDTFSEYFGNEISRDFLGSVIDKNHTPIEGVTITIGNETATTDTNGVFIIRGADVNERFGYIKAEKAGYIHGSRSVVPSEGTNKVQIMLLQETIVGTVSSGSSSTVIIDDGSSVSFDGNFIREDGSAYSGAVEVIMHHLDPNDEDMTLQMPGMLYAENEDGAERTLQTLGMLAVELRGSSDEDLNLAEGSSAEIKIPVHASLLASAPTSIPLWYFDEATGYWKEEGTATLEGNMYVGTVSHFSFWNCDIPAEAITFCVTATDENNNVLNNLYVTITSGTFGTRGGYSNDNGEVCGFVPSNESLILDVYSYDLCGDVPLHTQNVGSFSSDTSITVIVPDHPDIIQETVVGTFNTCDGEAVTEGYVQLSYGSQTFTDAVSDGNFEINLLRCNTNMTFGIEASDFVNLQSTNSISYTFSTPITNIGTISACNSITEFIQYSVDDEATVLITEGIETSLQIGVLSTGPLLRIIYEGNTENDTCIYILGILDNDTYEGVYVFNNENFLGEGFLMGGECLDINNNTQDSNHNVIYNLTSIGEIGEYIDINFSGPYEDINGNPHTINGVAHVLRDE